MSTPTLMIRSALALASFAPFLLAGGAAAQNGSSGLDDATIAHVAVTANAIDVELAELATRRASAERVKRFAATMIADHTAVNEQAAALAGRLGVTPTDNDVSRSLRADAASARERLERAPRAGFDRAYMEREVGYHRAVLQALDETLIPNTANDELRALLEQARAAVAAHLEHAIELRDSLGGGA